jgi:hypothetical protein
MNQANLNKLSLLDVQGNTGKFGRSVKLRKEIKVILPIGIFLPSIPYSSPPFLSPFIISSHHCYRPIAPQKQF